MAKKKQNKIFLVKKSKIKKLCDKYDFKNNVLVKEDGKAIEADYGGLRQTLVRYVTLDLNSKPVQSLIAFYESPKIINHVNNDETFREELRQAGCRYSKNDKLIKTKKIKEELTSWALCVDAEDLYLYLFKEGTFYAYYNQKILLENCPDIIESLLEDKIIKSISTPIEISGDK